MLNLSKNVSYSRINVFLECPELYRQRYIKRNYPQYQPLEEALILGTLSHACIEDYLNDCDKDNAISVNLRTWLTETCHLDICDNATRAEYGGGIDVNMLEEYAKSCGALLARCSESYTKEDKIRNKDGSAPKDPLEYMPARFKAEYHGADLDRLKFNLDNQAARVNRSFTRFSLANTAAKAIAYVYLFEIPEFVDKVKSVELDLSYNPVAFRDGRYFWNGILDTEYLSYEGAVILNDHKTEKSKRRPEDVAFDLQLNSYAAIRLEQTDKLPDYISITHLPTNTLLAAETDPSVVSLSMDYLEQVQEEIDHNIDTKPDSPWLKKWPSKYGSPCLRRHWKTGSLERVCPYITTCWPDYYHCIKEEVDAFFTIKTIEQEPLDVDY